MTTEQPKPVRVSIIGTAGRGSDGPKMSVALYRAMLAKATSVVQDIWKLTWPQIRLVSGGSAWSDHLAVDLYFQHQNECEGLTLFLPCEWDSDKKQFVDQGTPDWKANPGRSLNRYHSQMGDIKSLETLHRLVRANAPTGSSLDDLVIESSPTSKVQIVTTHKGFMNRNQQVAKSEYLLAFTWSETNAPNDGGTKHTWDHAPQTTVKYHVSLGSLGPQDHKHSTEPETSKRPAEEQLVDERPFKKPKQAMPINGLGYCPAFIKADEEGSLVKWIDSQTWSNVLSRRVQEYGYTYHTGKPGQPTTPIPKELLTIAQRLVDQKFMSSLPDQIIVNEYLPGQGIGAHTDHTKLFGGEVVSVSLLSDIVMTFTHYRDNLDLLLQRGSALALQGDARYKWMHSIAKRQSDPVDGHDKPRSRRVSLTFRHMLPQM